MTNLNPQDLALPGTVPARPKLKVVHPPQRRNYRFLKGPIPWDWLCRAAELPGRAAAVSLALWYWSGLNRSREVRVSYKDLGELGVNRYAARRALQALEHAGLVAVVRHRGRAPRVTLLDVPSDAGAPVGGNATDIPAAGGRTHASA